MGFINYIDGKYHHVRRYNQIAAVLLKYGFEDLVSYMDEKKRFAFFRKILPQKIQQESLHLSKWEKIRLACEELGPTFVKFGQILSSRPDLVPTELILEMEKLQDSVPPIAGNIAADVVERELQKPLDVLFASFEKEAYASASMAQVHKAVLKTGEQVVLKIQRPGIREVIEADIRIMYYLAAVFRKRIPALKNIDPVGLIRHFEASMLKELDFIHESVNIQRFRDNYQTDKGAGAYTTAPQVYQEYSTSRVLTMEFMRGAKISDVEKLNTMHINRPLVGERLVKTYFRQVFDHGFFHADPHPGNILVLPGDTICFLDFGMMGNILRKDLEDLGSLILAVFSRDFKGIIAAVQNLTDSPLLKDNRDLEADLFEFVNNYHVKRVHKNELSTLMLELKDIVMKHGIKLPSQFYLLARSLVSLEGSALQLDPHLDMMKIARPFMVKSIAYKYTPLKFGKRFFKSMYELGLYLEEFPRDLKTAMRRITSGEIQVQLEHKGIDPLIHTFNRISRQLVSAVIIGSLIIGSSLLINASMPPKWHNVSLLGLAGLSVALFLGIGLLNNLRKGDHDEPDRE